jgi:hemin uptake protein HemP
MATQSNRRLFLLLIAVTMCGGLLALRSKPASSNIVKSVSEPKAQIVCTSDGLFSDDEDDATFALDAISSGSAASPEAAQRARAFVLRYQSHSTRRGDRPSIEVAVQSKWAANPNHHWLPFGSAMAAKRKPAARKASRKETQATDGDSVPSEASEPDVSRRVIYTSVELLQGQREVWIEHGDDLYRLRVTHAGKLYLTK